MGVEQAYPTTLGRAAFASQQRQPVVSVPLAQIGGVGLIQRCHQRHDGVSQGASCLAMGGQAQHRLDVAALMLDRLGRCHHGECRGGHADFTGRKPQPSS